MACRPSGSVPLVEESEQSALTAAEDRFAALKEIFGNRVELVHGRMSAAKKDAAMARFQSGEAQVLVATTVVEVGGRRAQRHDHDR